MTSPIAIKLLVLAALGMGYVLLSAPTCQGDCDDQPEGSVCASNAQGTPTATCQSGDCKAIGTEPPTNKCGGGAIGAPCTSPSGDAGKCVLDVLNNVIVCGVGL